MVEVMGVAEIGYVAVQLKKSPGGGFPVCNSPEQWVQVGDKR